MIDAMLAALLLGLIEGVTEFLPVSSTAHLMLASRALGLPDPGKVFATVIQLGAALALCVHYRRMLAAMVRAGIAFTPKRAFRVLRDVDSREKEAPFRLALLLVLASLPAAAIGLLAHDVIRERFSSTQSLAAMLMTGGVAILFVERFRPAPRCTRIEDIPWKIALLIGLIQILALIPGVSRSGATILGALALGLDRRAAVEFSFLLAIPILLGAGGHTLMKYMPTVSLHEAAFLATGCAAAFIASMLVIRALLAFISRHSFAPFGLYRIALGGGMFLVL